MCTYAVTSINIVIEKIVKFLINSILNTYLEHDLYYLAFYMYCVHEILEHFFLKLTLTLKVE